ncbi:uncharacterized protein LACBIDRAFT_330552 [Laccaria bicolor S238N-H82]|uniref:Predicted protein n=1 Tax=Laccaria bicolor (strain S238N-H82 / ATCC MYA-4686) TaxID=486041 RepID=B0DLP2_LACBS|nr:uncharacterized protein LACBIDRAFT_330552 [Laccaria bicolor S238N-H82]EDR04331.1 predicted protein [Laccaria bicolor S238N-H82]|eukprot:XP_001884850.1 predicted protein [Laccaria bicolor S238N-H82]
MGMDDTRPVKKFKNSETPLEEERVKLEAKVIELDDLIKAHLDCMADLTNRSVLVKRQLNAQVAFARLPIEVVTIIFHLACSADYEPFSPLRIGSICHHWRTIAWSASELWSSVTVGLEVSREATKKQEDLLSGWLLRARKRPLSITIAIREEHDPRWDDPPADNSVLSLLLAHSGQWRSADIDIPSTLLHLLPDWLNAPILARLTLRCDLESYSDSPVIVHAPRLHSLILVGLYQMQPATLPWDQVRTLHIEGYGMQDFLDTLKRCSSLVNLVLNEQDCIEHEPTTTPLTVVKLDSLKSLHVNALDENCLMLDRLSTPHLEDLDVFFPEISQGSFKSFRTLVFRSSCAETITRFSFIGYIFSEEEMVSFLLGLPCLSELVLYNSKHAPPFSTTFIDALHSRDSESFLLPNLKRIHYTGPITLDSDKLLAMLDARYTNASKVAKLEAVSIHSYDQVVKKISDLPHVRMLRAQGLVVDVE